VDEQFARESHELRDQKIHINRTAIEVQVYGAEKVTTTNRRQFQVRPNRAPQVATRWSDADQQSTKERSEREIHHGTPVKHKLFDNLFQHHEQQSLQDVRTMATGLRSTFAKYLAQTKTATEEDV